MNPKVCRATQHKEQGYRYVNVADHLEHAPSLPLVLLEACLSGVETAGAYWSAGITSAYVVFYLGVTLLNVHLTGRWAYPVFEDAERAAGPLGVAAVIVVVAGFVSLLSLGGHALVSAMA